MELDGQVDRYSPVTIRGEVNPLAAETSLDMTMSFRNIEMASLTPYSGRFAGYTIRRGKLSADLNYKLNDLDRFINDADAIVTAPEEEPTDPSSLDQLDADMFYLYGRGD